MSSRRTASALAAALALAGSSLPVGAASAPSATPKTVLFDLYAHGHAKPKRVYLSANAGPWLRSLQRQGWGSARAVGHGTYVSDCASCPPPKRRSATLRLSRPVACTEGEGKGLRTYRRAVVTLSVPDQGSTVRTFRIPAGCP